MVQSHTIETRGHAFDAPDLAKVAMWTLILPGLWSVCYIITSLIVSIPF